MLTTVQDRGREGFGTLGVSPSGAADRVALRLGNALVGNPPGAAALEMTLTGGTFRFSDTVAVALTGADFGATLNGRPLGMWCTQHVDAGGQLQLAASRSGARCYLCVSGGIEVPLVMGSASTHLLSGLGGFQGRALKKGDVLSLGNGTPPARPRRVAPGALEAFAPRKVLRITEGPQADAFSAEARTALRERVFTVSEASNRMGLRLEGPLLDPGAHGEMISEGVSLGAIQVTPAGQPIVLFVEQQTAGGYPKIANVISADMHSVGQLRPRDEVRFEVVSFATARDLWMEQEELLNSPERSCT